MGNPIWTPPRFTTEERLKTANMITQLLCEKYKDSVLAVALEGSTAKGMDHPESDLELCVILTRAQMVSLFLSGHVCRD